MDQKILGQFCWFMVGKIMPVPSIHSFHCYHLNSVTWRSIYQVLLQEILVSAKLSIKNPIYYTPTVIFSGHGFSSHYPKGFYYHAVDYVPLLENIRQQYNWPQLSLLSHSMGAIISLVYASLFPQNVNLVCALDTLKIIDFEPKLVAQIYISRMKKLITLNDALMQQPPAYTYDELPERVRVGSRMSIDLDKTRYLIERGTQRSSADPNKFYFTRDIRVKFMQNMFVDQIAGLEYIKRIKTPYLFLRGDDRDFSESEEHINEAVEVFKRHNKLFEMMKVSGTHHFHLNHPEMIAGRVSEFLKKYHGKETIATI